MVMMEPLGLMWTLSVGLALREVWSARASSGRGAARRYTSAPRPRPLKSGCVPLTGSQMTDEESLETPGSNPEGDTGAPGPHSEFGAIRGRCPPTVVITTHPYLPHPTHSAWLTLQLLVPSLPLKAYRGCPIMDEALEAGILALLHGAAGRLDGDDRAPKAWGTRRQRVGLSRVGSARPRASASEPPALPAHGISHTHGRTTPHWGAQ